MAKGRLGSYDPRPTSSLLLDSWQIKKETLVSYVLVFSLFEHAERRERRRCCLSLATQTHEEPRPLQQRRERDAVSGRDCLSVPHNQGETSRHGDNGEQQQGERQIDAKKKEGARIHPMETREIKGEMEGGRRPPSSLKEATGPAVVTAESLSPCFLSSLFASGFLRLVACS